MAVRTPFLTIVLSSFVAAGAYADPITVTASGTLDVVRCGTCLEPVLGFGAAVGDPFTLSLSFDSDAPRDTSGLAPEMTFYPFGRGKSRLTLGNNTVDLLSSDIGSTVTNGYAGVLDSLSLSGHQCAPRAPNCDLLVGIAARDASGRLLASTARPDDVTAVFNRAPSRTFYLLEDGEGSPVPPRRNYLACQPNIHACASSRTRHGIAVRQRRRGRCPALEEAEA